MGGGGTSLGIQWVLEILEFYNKIIDPTCYWYIAGGGKFYSKIMKGGGVLEILEFYNKIISLGPPTC